MPKAVFSRLVVVVTIALTLGAGLAGGAQAQRASPTAQASPAADILAFVFYPSGKQPGDFVSATINAGKSAKITIILGDTGNIAFDARTYAVNAGTAPNGGFLAANAGVAPAGPTTWLTYPEKVFALTPGKGVQVELTIAVPKDTAPGQYLTSLIVENAEPRSVEGTSTFKKVIRQALPVFITVPGTVSPKFEVGNITLMTQGDGSALTIGIKNPGNVRVRPAGTVTLTDASDATVLTAPVAMDSVYAHDQTTLSIGVPALAAGDYKVSVDLKDPDTGAKASVSDVVVSAQAPATPVAASSISFTAATAAAAPSLDKIQFLNISATIANNGAPLTNARLTLSVSHDGKTVEDYPLSASLALPIGNTVVSSRYIPATGWSSGAWAFTLKLESVDLNTNVAAVLAVTDLGGPIVVP